MLYPMELELAGAIIRCAYEYVENLKLCGEYARPIQKLDGCVYISDYEKSLFLDQYPNQSWSSEQEDKNMAALVSDELLAYDRFVFHSVAFLWNEKAWLITAPSGTGKTTQYRNLKELFVKEIEIICGDNPVLHFQEDGKIMVYSTPWTGKEGYGSEKKMNAALGGVIWLKQAKCNSIEKFDLADAVCPIYNEINTFAKTESRVHKLLALEERLLTSVPIWKFENDGSLESSEMLMNCIRSYERK